MASRLLWQAGSLVRFGGASIGIPASELVSQPVSWSASKLVSQLVSQSEYGQ